MNEQNGTKEKISWEHRVTKIETLVELMYENELPHLRRRLNWVIGILASLLVGIIIALIRGT